jgi:hypothetical protein
MDGHFVDFFQEAMWRLKSSTFIEDYFLCYVKYSSGLGKF